jgi:hypothetical protein
MVRFPSLPVNAMLGVVLVLFAHHAHAQQDQIPGPPPDEYVDVTGDGRADLLITSRTIHISDPQQPGYLGLIKVGVRTISGTSVLLWSTPSTQRWFTVDSAARLDTAELSKRIHFKQLRWTDQDVPTEFWLLERPFGPAITKDQDGWYGTGEHHDGHTLVMRSANDLGTSVAAFTFELPFPYGRVAVRSTEAVRVPNGYGEEGDPVHRDPVGKDGNDFGHEEYELQVMVPPGVPPNEPIDLTSDDIPDLVITGENAPHHSSAPPLGTYHRGVRMLPGAALLMEKQADGQFALFKLQQEGALTPEELRTGLTNDRFRWAEPPHWPEFIEVLTQKYGSLRTADEPPGWLPASEPLQDNFVFRGTQYGRPMLGCFEVSYTTPGGELGVRLMGLVDEGEVLRVH